jgi:hypothetical protein
MEELKGIAKNELAEWEMDRKNWIRKAEFVDGTDDAAIPTEWLKGVLIRACKDTKMVPHFATSKRETYTRYMSSVMIDNITPVCKREDLEEYACYVTNPNSKGSKMWRVRPMLTKWSTTFDLIDILGRVQKSELEELFRIGGFLIGIGDNRVNNFGRFEVKNIVEDKKNV